MIPQTPREIAPIWALLIGINSYKINTLPGLRIPELRGCVNDVEALAEHLRTQLDVPEARIRLLRNEEATYHAVIAGFTHFLAPAAPGEQVLVYFSCHGAQATAVDLSLEADGLDETLVLYDSRTDGVYDLLDKELGYLVHQLVARGLNVTLVLDACHSGSGSRDLNGDQPRLATVDPRLRRRDQIYGGEAALALAGRLSTSSDWASPGEGASSYVLIAGCRADQMAREADLDGSGRVHGLLSYFLLQELRRGLPPTMTYADLHHVLLARIRSRRPDQEPQIEGDRSRGVFAAGRWRRPPRIGLRAVHGAQAKLDIGAAQGVTTDTTLLAFADADVADAARALARLTVMSAGALTSQAQIELLGETSELPIDAFLVIERMGFYPAQRVLLDGTGLEAVRAALAEAGPGGKPSPYIELVTNIAAAQIVVRRNADTYQVCNPEGRPLIADVRLMPRQDGDPIKQVLPLVYKLEHLARYRYAADLRPKTDRETLKPELEVALYRVEDGENVLLTEDMPLLHNGDQLGLRVLNKGTSKLWASVWNFSADWSVQPLFPNDIALELAPGVLVEREFGGSVELPAGLPEGVEQLRVFVTEQPSQAFAVLEMDALDVSFRSIPKDTGDDSPLGQFLASLARGQRALSGGGIERWSVVDRLARVVGDL